MTDRHSHTFRALVLAVLLAPLYFYRWAVSPLLPHVCRFDPSCSVYALEALKVHGPWKGVALAARRLSRCHPIAMLGGSSGFDPVPPPQ